MSYVEYCKKHGQHHSEICGECVDDLQAENARLREALEWIATDFEAMSLYADVQTLRIKARAALEQR